jgi:hypothetical protein
MQYQNDPEAMGLVAAYNKINNSTFQYNETNTTNTRSKERRIINKAIKNQAEATSLTGTGNALTGTGNALTGTGNALTGTGTIFNEPNSNIAKGLRNANMAQPANVQQPANTVSFLGGKPKSKSSSKKSKSSSKKTKAKKPKAKGSK